MVLCSAGIGRTGTYIALDILLEQLKDEEEVSVFGCAETLRLQRMTMVQTVVSSIYSQPESFLRALVAMLQKQTRSSSMRHTPMSTI